MNPLGCERNWKWDFERDFLSIKKKGEMILLNWGSERYQSSLLCIQKWSNKKSSKFYFSEIVWYLSCKWSIEENKWK